jgi:trk system potassium uptake protein TrkH
MRTNEALLLTATIFSIASLGAVWPLMTSTPAFIDALFEAVSGITTTGLTTLGSLADRTGTFYFARAYLQWIGGLGIVIFSVAILMGPGLAARRLALPDQGKEGIVHAVGPLSRKILLIYAMLTAGGILGLILLGIRPFSAIVHTMAAVSTGGFSPFNESLAALGSPLQEAGVLFLSVLGAVSLPLYYFTKKSGLKKLVKDPEFRALLIILFGAVVLQTAALAFSGNWGWRAALRHGPFMALSAQTTSGFSTVDVSSMPATAKMILILSMAVGGSTGSTAGGIKIFRLLVLAGVVRMVVARTAMSRHAVADVRLGGNKLEEVEINRVFTVIFLYILTVFASWLAFLGAGYDPLNSLFDVVSAVGTVGLSSGLTGPDLPGFLKLVLCLDMMLGRLEMICFLILFYPWTWKGMKFRNGKEFL